MKLFGPKSLSYYLFFASRIAAIGSILLVAYILLSLGLGNYTLVKGQFQIPLTPFGKTYIKGFYETDVIVTISLLMVFFTVFFYLLSNILKTFKAEKLFTSKAIAQLHYFALLNLVVGPLLYLIIHFAIMQKANLNDIHNLFLGLILGTFALFTAAVFKRGYEVQDENDLTI